MKCNDDNLRRLLYDEKLSGSENATKHLDTCADCQRRLLELAATRDAWRDVTEALSDAGPESSSVVIAIDPELATDMPVQADQISLSFLEPPRHPELLGRIHRYDVERMIGAGGMGIVLKAFDPELHRPVAIKVLAPHLAHSGGARQRFAREAQSAASVVHENVVPIHNVDTEGTLPFLVMQYVPGDSLQARIDRDGPLGAHEILRIGLQIAHGLAAAHQQGLIHRDVKPGNILLEEGVDRVLISDFGLARTADDASVTRSGVIAGTPHYMSPEQASGDPIDARSDLFGLGSVLYFMATGHPPFRAEGAMAVLRRICDQPHRPVDEVNAEIPADLAQLIDALLEKSPSRRPAAATVVADQIAVMLRKPVRRTRRGFLRSGRMGSRVWSRAGRSVMVAIAGGLLIGAAAWWNSHSAHIKATNQLTDVVPIFGDPQPTPGEAAPPSDRELVMRTGDGEAGYELFSDAMPDSPSASEAAVLAADVSTPRFLVDGFAAELAQLRGDMVNLETRLKQSVPTLPSQETWQVELQSVQATMKTMEQGVPIKQQGR